MSDSQNIEEPGHKIGFDLKLGFSEIKELKINCWFFAGCFMKTVLTSLTLFKNLQL
jgi:hypothetical protein